MGYVSAMLSICNISGYTTGRNTGDVLFFSPVWFHQLNEPFLYLLKPKGVTYVVIFDIEATFFQPLFRTNQF